MTLPSGTVTFLFTDIEGSTKLWEQSPEAMGLALARHDALLRATIGSHHGLVFKTIGDAFCATFATASDAVAAAFAAQCALHQESWEEPIRIKVRMALHTGAAEQRDNDYFGQPLNRVSRLLAIGYGGQILLSDVTRELIHDTLPHGAVLKFNGEHRLRDLNRPEQVYQLLHSDLPSDFPPLKSLDNPEYPNNLPQQVTSFIGREKETAEVKELLTKTRLLTLTGSGGCGKTRLALQVAADALETFPEGVWVVELASLTDPALLPQAVAQALGEREEPGQSLLQTLTSALKTKHLLLALDNCEHLLAACARLADALLRACPYLKILASSREGLGIIGEQTYRVPSLSLPDPKRKTTPADLHRYEAVRLFVDRAVLSKADFIVTTQNAPVLAQVCARLDGIPLAIELAAARVRSLAIEEINNRLDNRFRLLTGGSRTALPRQQTLRALIDWSYDLLNAQERLLLHRLSVFVGGWTLEAAEAVCVSPNPPAPFPGRSLPLAREGGDSALDSPLSHSVGEGGRGGEGQWVGGSGDASIEDWEVLDLMTSLVDKSLVVSEQSGSHSRYRLLETVRQYARDKLTESGEDTILRGQHRDYLLNLVEESVPKLDGPDQAEWYERLETEHDNLRAAIAWGLLDENGAETGLRLVGSLARFWNTRGYLTEGRRHLIAALSQPGVAAPTQARGNALNGAGLLANQQGDYAEALARFSGSLAIRQELADRRGVAGSLNNLGMVTHNQGDFPAARAYFQQALDINREIGNRSWEAIAVNNLGCVARDQGDYPQARTFFEQSLALNREMGNQANEAIALNNLGMVAHYQSDYAHARIYLDSSLGISRDIGNRVWEAIALGNLGSLAKDEGELAQARAYLEESRDIHREIGDRANEASALDCLGEIAATQGDRTRARSLYAQAIALQQQVGQKGGIASTLESLAALCVLEHRFPPAAQLYGAADALRDSIGTPIPPSDQAERARHVAATRAALGEEAWNAAWTAGRIMPLEESIAYALEQTQDETRENPAR